MLFICFIRKKGNGAIKLDFNMSLPLQTFDQRAEPTLLYFHPVRRMQKEEVVSALVFTPLLKGICCLVCCFVTFFLLHNCFFVSPAALGTTRCQTPPVCLTVTSGPCIWNTKTSWRHQVLMCVSICIMFLQMCYFWLYSYSKLKYNCICFCHYSAARWN